MSAWFGYYVDELRRRAARLGLQLKHHRATVRERKMSPIERELEAVDRAIRRYEAQLSDLVRESNFEPGIDCCASCAVPGYSDLADQIDRTRSWREKLAAKVASRSAGCE